jgi:hypothetical protein
MVSFRDGNGRLQDALAAKSGSHERDRGGYLKCRTHKVTVKNNSALKESVQY